MKKKPDKKGKKGDSAYFFKCQVGKQMDAVPFFGFTLIELVLAIVIGGIILIPTSVVVVESVRNTFLPEHYTIAASLLRERTELLTNLLFSEVIGERPTPFTGAFSDYSYEVVVDYVDPGDLNTPIGGSSDYKRAQVTVSHAGFPDVAAVILRTNN